MWSVTATNRLFDGRCHMNTSKATNAIQSRDLERVRELCGTQNVERGKSTHPSFADFGHHWCILYDKIGRIIGILNRDD